MKATQVVLRRLVNTGEVAPTDFEVKQVEVQDDLQEGQLLCELIYLSVDPYMRGLMRESAGYFLPPFTPGQPVASGGVARVVKSAHPDYSEGDYMSGLLPWQSPCVVGGTGEDGQKSRLPTKLDTSAGVPLSYFLGALGMPGFTAYGPLKTIGQPKEGETVFVSAAAGAVGQLVGQLAKQVYGCKVVGSAGSDEKVEFLLKQLGFDSAFNYKQVNTSDALKQHAPDGIDIYYDNVGGETLEAALDHCKVHARVIACGAISQYNLSEEQRYGVKNLFLIVTKRIKMEGFVIGDLMPDKQLFGEFLSTMSALVRENKVKAVEDVVAGGLEQAGPAFVGMMAGNNIGKRVVQVGQDPFRK